MKKRKRFGKKVRAIIDKIHKYNEVLFSEIQKSKKEG